MTLKAILFDHTVLQKGLAYFPNEFPDFWHELRSRGLSLVAMATHPRDLARLRERFHQQGLCEPDLLLSREDIPDQKNKGSPLWIATASQRLHVQPHELTYVGDDVLAWRTAMNGGVLYLHALWSEQPGRVPRVIGVNRPQDLLIFLDHMLLRSPTWSFRIDSASERVHLRCLLPANTDLPGDHGSFRLQDIFTYNRTDITVGGTPALHLLMLHALGNLYAEGLIRPGTYFCSYPPHAPGETNPVLDGFLGPATAFFARSYLRPWIRRFSPAPDTSRLRARGGQADFTNQTNTVCLDSTACNTLSRGPTVIVFDDFTTDGMSLGWANNLLLAAGAAKVVLVAIGKYGKRHNQYIPRIRINPFEEATYAPSDFHRNSLLLTPDSGAETTLKLLFKDWQDKRPAVYLIGNDT